MPMPNAAILPYVNQDIKLNFISTVLSFSCPLHTSTIKYQHILPETLRIQGLHRFANYQICGTLKRILKATKSENLLVS